MTNKNTAEYLIAHTDKFYERKEELVWLTVGKQDVDKRLGFETSDEDWYNIFELLKLKVEQELDILIEDSIESIFGV
jgi:uncharacterized protein (DUF952 family)